MIKEALHKVINNEDLTYEEALETMKEIMTGEASQIQMAAFLTALRMKGETITEITACAKGMRAVGTHLQPKKEVLEIVGTGGDEVGTFNISTTSAFVIAAAGIPVAKHGNRSVSSKSGAADILDGMSSPNCSPNFFNLSLTRCAAFLYCRRASACMSRITGSR